MDIYTDLIAERVYRICLVPQDSMVAFNHFLIVDERPALVHLGQAHLFDWLHEAVGKLIDPSTLAYLAFSHYEPDECGALSQWLAVAPQAEVCVGKIGAMSMRDVMSKSPKVMQDGESVSLGQDALMLLETPHFPHNWDACLFYLKPAKILFGSDLGTQIGYRPPFVTDDPTADIMDLQQKMAYMPYGPAMASGLAKLKQLDIQILAAMHGAMLNEAQCRHLLQALETENAPYTAL